MKKTKKETKKIVTKPDIKTAVKRGRKPKETPVQDKQIEQPLDITEHVEVVIKRYVLADQTPLVRRSLGRKGFKESNCNPEQTVYALTKYQYYYLIYNDLADLLAAKHELILKNEHGTWWVLKIGDLPLNQNKALIEITRDAIEKEAKEKAENAK